MLFPSNDTEGCYIDHCGCTADHRAEQHRRDDRAIDKYVIHSFTYVAAKYQKQHADYRQEQDPQPAVQHIVRAGRESREFLDYESARR